MMSGRGPFPQTRMRRLRASAFARDMVRESTLSPADFIYPVFVLEGSGQREAVPSMPGVERLSIDLLVALAKEAHLRTSAHIRGGEEGGAREGKEGVRAPKGRTCAPVRA